MRIGESVTAGIGMVTNTGIITVITAAMGMDAVMATGTMGMCGEGVLLFTAQEPLIATIRGGIPSFAAQKPPHIPGSYSYGMRS